MQRAAKFRGLRIVLPRSATNHYQRLLALRAQAVRSAVCVPRELAVDCNFSVAELSLSPGKSGTNALWAFFVRHRADFCLLRASL
jgi:hypothetical protein